MHSLFSPSRVCGADIQPSVVLAPYSMSAVLTFNSMSTPCLLMSAVLTLNSHFLFSPTHVCGADTQPSNTWHTPPQHIYMQCAARCAKQRAPATCRNPCQRAVHPTHLWIHIDFYCFLLPQVCLSPLSLSPLFCCSLLPAFYRRSPSAPRYPSAALTLWSSL